MAEGGESIDQSLKKMQNYSVSDQGARKPNELGGVILAGASWMAGDEKTRLAKQAFGEHKDKILWKARNYKLDNMDVLYEEVMHMKMLGYEPKTDAVKKLIDEGFPALEQYMKTKDTEFPRVHVHIAPDESVTIAVLAKQSNLEMGAYTHDSLAAAPTFIQQQVGLLKMMDKNTHVPDVGYKSSDTEFWIEGFSQ
jgi:hypothetical protein